MAFWLGLLSVVQKIKEEEVGYHRYFAEEKINTPTEIYAIKMHEPHMVSAAAAVVFLLYSSSSETIAHKVPLTLHFKHRFTSYSIYQ